MKIKIPVEWKDKEVHFIWDSECEALLWNANGHPLQAFVGSLGEDRRSEYVFPADTQIGTFIITNFPRRNSNLLC